MSSIEIGGHSVDDISKTLGVLAVGAYVVGYIVLSFHLARFGVSPSSVFRPRILEAGLCTILFIAPSVLFGVAVAYIPGRGIPYALAAAMRFLLVLILSDTISVFPGFTRDLPAFMSQPMTGLAMTEDSGLIIGLTIVAAALLVVALWWVSKNYHRHCLSSFMLLLIPAYFFAKSALGRGIDSSHTRFFIWFVSISTLTYMFIGKDGEQVYESQRKSLIKKIELNNLKLDEILLDISPNGNLPLSEDEQRQALDSKALEVLVSKALEVKNENENNLVALRSHTHPLIFNKSITANVQVCFVVYFLFTILIFSTWIYPKIPFKLGGGMAVPVTIYESLKSIGPTVVRGSMLDQSDDGIYVVIPTHDKALFIPKEAIEVIYFADGPSDLRTTLH